MLTAIIPFKYGKGTEHWNFMPGDPIADGIIAPDDLKKAVAKKQVKLDTSTPEYKADGGNKANKIKNSRTSIDYLKKGVVEAKELINAENDVSSLLSAKSVEEKQDIPRKTITDAIKRRVFEITGKRIP